MSRFISIDDPDDARLAFFRNIRERDLSRSASFVAEGTVVVESLLGSPFFSARSLLILANRVDGLHDLLSKVPVETPIYVAERRVIDAVAGFPMHRGVLAEGVRRRDVAATGADIRLDRIAARSGVVVAAIDIANHDNMGAIFRNARAFGAHAVLLDSTCCDPLYRKSIRVSAGSALQLPFQRLPAEKIVERLREHGFASYALSPRGREPIDAVDRDGPMALLLGSEGSGLPDWIIRSAGSVRIDMVPGFDSLNVATAAAIVLQRIYSSRPASDRAG